MALFYSFFSTKAVAKEEIKKIKRKLSWMTKKGSTNWTPVFLWIAEGIRALFFGQLFASMQYASVGFDPNALWTAKPFSRVYATIEVVLLYFVFFSSFLLLFFFFLVRLVSWPDDFCVPTKKTAMKVPEVPSPLPLRMCVCTCKHTCALECTNAWNTALPICIRPLFALYPSWVTRFVSNSYFILFIE